MLRKVAWGSVGRGHRIFEYLIQMHLYPGEYARFARAGQQID